MCATQPGAGCGVRLVGSGKPGWPLALLWVRAGWARCGVWSLPRAQRRGWETSPCVRRTARRRLRPHAACWEQEAKGGGALALLGAKRAGPAVECGRRHEHREERLGASPWCAAQPGAGCGVQLVRSGKPEGRWSCWVREGCVRCGARSPLLRIAACDRRAGPWLRAAHHRNEDAFLSIVSRYRPLSPRGYPEVRCASCHSLLCAADTPLDIASSGRIRESNGTTFPTHRTSYGPP